MKRRPDLAGNRWERLRRRILDRDSWRCSECGRAGKLEIHHLVSPLVCPDRAHDSDNLLVLCVDCHLDLHGRKEPDPEVLEWQEFVRTSEQPGEVGNIKKDTRGSLSI